MGVPVMIMGESGSGKSASLRNFEPDELAVYNIAGKPLPFRTAGKWNMANNVKYPNITANLKKKKFKTYVIDDSQYLLCFELFERVSEKSYDKFTDMANNFYKLLRMVTQDLPEDVIVYFLHHTEIDSNGKAKVKTIGKMLDEKLTVEGLFSIVLMAVNDGGEYKFVTHSDGRSTVKSPMGMFAADEIENDLKMVDTTIREYYGFTSNNERID